MSRILILTAAFGEGHNAAARALSAAFQELGAEPNVVDIFEKSGKAVYARSRRMYLDLIHRAPRIWAALYTLMDRTPIVPALLAMMPRSRRLLADFIAEFSPAAVLSVYPAYAYLIARPRNAPSSRPPFYTVITDSITINSSWYRAESDLYFVPNEETARVFAKTHIEPGKIRVLGFPVSPRFVHHRSPRPAPGARVPLRVLYMVNGGRELASAIVAELLAIPELAVSVTVGRDEALGAQLDRIARTRPIQIHGWTDQMPELLMTHHLLIGKAGGATVQETIAACTPMIITNVVPGQEEGNAQLLIGNGSAALCRTPPEIRATIRALIENDAKQWHHWTAAITRLSRPSAALDIARAVLAET